MKTINILNIILEILDNIYFKFDKQLNVSLFILLYAVMKTRCASNNLYIQLYIFQAIFIEQNSFLFFIKKGF